MNRAPNYMVVSEPEYKRDHILLTFDDAAIISCPNAYDLDKPKPRNGDERTQNPPPQPLPQAYRQKRADFFNKIGPERTIAWRKIVNSRNISL